VRKKRQPSERLHRGGERLAGKRHRRKLGGAGSDDYPRFQTDPSQARKKNAWPSAFTRGKVRGGEKKPTFAVRRTVHPGLINAQTYGVNLRNPEKEEISMNGRRSKNFRGRANDVVWIKNKVSERCHWS